jgi:hypothetical protein
MARIRVSDAVSRDFRTSAGETLPGRKPPWWMRYSWCMYGPSDRPKTQLAQRLAHKSGYGAAGAVLIWAGGGAAAIAHEQPVAGGHIPTAEVRLMSPGTASVMDYRPVHREVSRLGSGVAYTLHVADSLTVSDEIAKTLSGSYA